MSRIEDALSELSKTLLGKNKDYAPEGEFSNFEEAARQVSIKPEDVMLAQIVIKLTRIRTLRESGAAPNNEALEDSYKDLAGYAILLYAYTGRTPPQADRVIAWNGVLDA